MIEIVNGYVLFMSYSDFVKYFPELYFLSLQRAFLD